MTLTFRHGFSIHPKSRQAMKRSNQDINSIDSSFPADLKGPKPAITHRILPSEIILDASSQFSSFGGSTEFGDGEISSELGTRNQESVSQANDPQLSGLIR
jgi:hypothetical protein